MKLQVMYHVIYTVELCRSQENPILPAIKYNNAVPDFVSNNVGKRKLFEITERNRFTDKDDYGSDVVWGSRKYVGVLDASQLKEFAEAMGVQSTCGTMGALTLSYGWLPAIAWDYNDASYDGYLAQAYISPMVGTPADFDKIEAAYKDDNKQLEWFRVRYFTPLVEKVMLELQELQNGETQLKLDDEDFEFTSELWLDNVGIRFIPEIAEETFENNEN